MFHFMRLGLTTEGAETPVRAARKEACERIRFAQLGRNSPTLDGRQMICGRGVDEWHEVRLPPSSFRAPRSGFPRFQWLTDCSVMREWERRRHFRLISARGAHRKGLCSRNICPPVRMRKDARHRQAPSAPKAFCHISVSAPCRKLRPPHRAGFRAVV